MTRTSNTKFIKRHLHTFMMVFWIAMVPVTLIWLKDSVLWIALMSLYSNVEASAAARESRKARDE